MSHSQQDQDRAPRDDGHDDDMIAQATAPGAKEPGKAPRDEQHESDIDVFDEEGAGIAAKE